MNNTISHINWLFKKEIDVRTKDGKVVEIWELQPDFKNDIVFSNWAKHFRSNYCSDDEIDYLRKGYNYTRSEYLYEIKFPDCAHSPGPSIRAGDFGEILVSDFLEYLLGYWVPRTRHRHKTSRNESTRGSDIIGFKIFENDSRFLNNEMTIYEVKTQFTGRQANNRLQDAVRDSAKDITRKAESLNAIKQRLCRGDAEKIELFQNEVDHPYNEIYGAAALFENKLFDSSLISSIDVSSHPHSDRFALIIITGESMMDLIHELYRRAADEA